MIDLDKTICHDAYLICGSNLDKPYALLKGLELLYSRFYVVNQTPIYDTPSTVKGQSSFLNAGLHIQTRYYPMELKYHILRDIEFQCGRERTSNKFMDRTLDIDLCLYDPCSDSSTIQCDPDIGVVDHVTFLLSALVPDYVLESGKTLGQVSAEMSIESMGFSLYDEDPIVKERL